MRELKTVRQLVRLMRPWRWTLPAVVVLGLASFLAEGVGVGLFVPVVQSMVDGSSAGNPAGRLVQTMSFGLVSLSQTQHLSFVMLAVLALITAKGLLVYSNEVLGSWLASRVSQVVRCSVFSSILNIDHSRLDSLESGRLMNILGTDTWHTADAVVMLVGTIVDLCAIVVFGVMLIALSWKMTALVGAGVVLISLLLATLNTRARCLGRQCIEKNAALSEQMLDGLEGVRVIQAFGLERHRSNLFTRISESVRSAYFRLDLISRAIHPATEVLYGAVLVFTLCIGIWMRIPAASMLVFLVLMYRLHPKFGKLNAARVGLVSLAGSVGDVMRLIETPDREHASRQLPAAPIQSIRHGIYFDNVDFSYESGRIQALRGISLRIERGRVVAIVGRSGAGKSTLVNLLCRFREPLAGEIRVDGTPLGEIDKAEWRRRIALAGQATYIFSATVRDNIACGRLDATDAEIRQAARKAQAEEFIKELPAGFETKIGNGGATLSGGQEQRIALARAFLRQPDLFIFDEATNALDSITEEFIQQVLDRLEDRTVLIISHRLSTIRRADHVIVLDEGRVLEQGAPETLLRKASFLSTLRELQEAHVFA
jgi:subfamily B ATP-binding cassette protein MsbA